MFNCTLRWIFRHPLISDLLFYWHKLRCNFLVETGNEGAFHIDMFIRSLGMNTRAALLFISLQDAFFSANLLTLFIYL